MVCFVCWVASSKQKIHAHETKKHNHSTMCSKGGSCSSLNRLNLDVAVKQLQDKSSIVEKLELLDAGIDDSGAKRLAEALQLDNHHSIKSLYLNANKISDVGFIALIEALKSNFFKKKSITNVYSVLS